MDNIANIDVEQCVGYFRKMVNSHMDNAMYDRNGNMVGVSKIWGWVKAVYMEPGDEKYGTADIQEFNPKLGDIGRLHEGVLLSSLDMNVFGDEAEQPHNGAKNDVEMMVVPALYSDVIVEHDLTTGKEYIVAVSHIQHIKHFSHDVVEIGVKETEPFEEGEDTPDVHELEETGNAATTTYTKDNIIHSVKTPDGETVITQTADGVVVKSGENTEVVVRADGTVVIKTSQVTVEAKDSYTVKSPSIKHNGGGQKMVKGNDMVKELEKLCDEVSKLGQAITSGTCANGSPLSSATTVKNVSTNASNIKSALSRHLSSKSFLE